MDIHWATAVIAGSTFPKFWQSRISFIPDKKHQDQSEGKLMKAILIRVLSALAILGQSFGASVTLAWDPSAGSPAGYKVYSKEAGSTQTSAYDVGNNTTAAVENLIPGASYSFYVTAYDANKIESNPSSALNYMVPTGPTSNKFLRSDWLTQGNWIGTYGAEGFWQPTKNSSMPASVAVSNSSPTWLWSSNASTVSAPLLPGTSSTRIAACWYSDTELDFDFVINDSNVRCLTMYFWDDYNVGREEKVDLVDKISGDLIYSMTLTNFSGGVYLTWQVAGQVAIRVTATKGNAVVSGIFIDSLPPTAARFIGMDSTTQGNWPSVYGTEAAFIARDSIRDSVGLTVNMTSHSEWTYSTDGTDARAPVKNDGSGRIAGVWYSRYPTTNAFLINIGLPDQRTHRLSVYVLDWYNQARAIQIDVINAKTGELLDSQQSNSYWGGNYLTWAIKGSVGLRVSTLAGPNAMVSGLFLDPSPIDL